MKRIFVSLFAVAVLSGVSLAQDPTPSASSSPTPQEQQTPATAPQPQAAPEPSTSPTPGSTSAQPNAQSPEQTQPAPQAPQAAPQAQQNPQPRNGNSQESAAANRIAPGSVIPVELTKGIDAKKAKTGDEVVARVTMDLKTNSGEVVVPKDTKVVGHVTEAQTRSKEQKDSQVGIIFDRAVMKNGGEMQMPMSIQAIIAPQNSNSSANNNDQPSAPSANAGGSPSSGGRPGMGGGGTPPPAPSASTGSNTPTDASTGASAHEPITGKTEGVVGLRDLKLATTAPDTTQGSVVSSEKNNVKLESGTFMLLRVNQ